VVQFILSPSLLARMRSCGSHAQLFQHGPAINTPINNAQNLSTEAARHGELRLQTEHRLKKA
jgi:hypothetical protein